LAVWGKRYFRFLIFNLILIFGCCLLYYPLLRVRSSGP
jgi:hypothetical protein